MFELRRVPAIALLTALSWVGGAQAQLALLENTGPLKPGFGGDVTLQGEWDDNVLRLDRNRRGDGIVRLLPKFDWNAGMGKHRLRLGYDGQWARYRSLDSENYQDHHLSANGLLDFSLRFKSEIAAEFRHAHDSRGSAESVFREGQDPDRWNLAGLDVGVNYGRLDAIGRVLARARYQARRYLNNGQDFRDRDRAGLEASFYYRVAPKTYLLTELAGERIDYIRTAPRDLDSREWRWLLGVRWEATARTSGELRAGYQRKDFLSDALDDFSGLALNLRIDWRPRSYSEVEIVVDRSPQETSLDGTDFYLRNLLQVGWRHGFSAAWGTQLRMSLERDEYEGGRQDDLLDINATLWWRPLSRLETGLRIGHAQRESDVEGVNFRSRSVMLYLKTDFE